MRVIGTINGHKIHMLVDSSSTYNFIDEFTTRKVGCHMSGSPPMSVVVTDRNRILCNQMCVGLV